MSDLLKHVCGCGKEVQSKKVSSHYEKCPIMKKRYAKLFEVVDKEITKKSTSVQDWENLGVVFEFLRLHLGQMIGKEKKKGSHFGKP